MSFIGIDVAKAQLEFACRPSGETGAVPNDETGIHTLLVRCQKLAATLIVCEATGGYEAALVAALATAGLPVVIANPRQVRDFAKATGQLAKTDALDAQILALFAERVRPEPRAATRRGSSRLWMPSSPGGGSWSRCSAPSATACSSPAPRCGAISSTISASSSAGCEKPMTTCTRR